MCGAWVNLYHEALMDRPSIPRNPWCPICGNAGPTTEHHIVPKAQNPGWKKRPGPSIYPCGHGTAGCHGKFEDKKLHLRWSEELDWWEVLELPRPMKYERALMQEGWQRLRAA